MAEGQAQGSRGLTRWQRRGLWGAAFLTLLTAGAYAIGSSRGRSLDQEALTAMNNRASLTATAGGEGDATAEDDDQSAEAVQPSSTPSPSAPAQVASATETMTPPAAASAEAETATSTPTPDVVEISVDGDLERGLNLIEGQIVAQIAEALGLDNIDNYNFDAIGLEVDAKVKQAFAQLSEASGDTLKPEDVSVTVISWDRAEYSRITLTHGDEFSYFEVHASRNDQLDSAIYLVSGTQDSVSLDWQSVEGNLEEHIRGATSLLSRGIKQMLGGLDYRPRQNLNTQLTRQIEIMHDYLTDKATESGSTLDNIVIDVEVAEVNGHTILRILSTGTTEGGDAFSVRGGIAEASLYLDRAVVEAAEETSEVPVAAPTLDSGSSTHITGSRPASATDGPTIPVVSGPQEGPEPGDMVSGVSETGGWNLRTFFDSLGDVADQLTDQALSLEITEGMTVESAAEQAVDAAFPDGLPAELENARAFILQLVEGAIDTATGGNLPAGSELRVQFKVGELPVVTLIAGEATPEPTRVAPSTPTAIPTPEPTSTPTSTPTPATEQEQVEVEVLTEAQVQEGIRSALAAYVDKYAEGREVEYWPTAASATTPFGSLDGLVDAYVRKLNNKGYLEQVVQVVLHESSPDTGVIHLYFEINDHGWFGVTSKIVFKEAEQKAVEAADSLESLSQLIAEAADNQVAMEAIETQSENSWSHTVEAGQTMEQVGQQLAADSGMDEETMVEAMKLALAQRNEQADALGIKARNASGELVPFSEAADWVQTYAHTGDVASVFTAEGKTFVALFSNVLANAPSNQTGQLVTLIEIGGEQPAAATPAAEAAAPQADATPETTPEAPATPAAEPESVSEQPATEPVSGWAEAPDPSAFVRADHDGDGDQDVVVATNIEGLQAMRGEAEWKDLLSSIRYLGGDAESFDAAISEGRGEYRTGLTWQEVNQILEAFDMLLPAQTRMAFNGGYETDGDVSYNLWDAQGSGETLSVFIDGDNVYLFRGDCQNPIEGKPKPKPTPPPKATPPPPKPTPTPPPVETPPEYTAGKYSSDDTTPEGAGPMGPHYDAAGHEVRVDAKIRTYGSGADILATVEDVLSGRGFNIPVSQLPEGVVTYFVIEDNGASGKQFHTDKDGNDGQSLVGFSVGYVAADGSVNRFYHHDRGAWTDPNSDDFGVEREHVTGLAIKREGNHLMAKNPVTGEWVKVATPEQLATVGDTLPGIAIENGKPEGPKEETPEPPVSNPPDKDVPPAPEPPVSNPPDKVIPPGSNPPDAGDPDKQIP